MTNEDQVRKGRRAQQIIEDEVLNIAIEKLENDQLWKFRDTKPEESAKRESAWAMLKAIEGFRGELMKMVDNGKVAQRAIERAQKNLI